MLTPAAALREIILWQVRVNKRQLPVHIFIENFWIFGYEPEDRKCIGVSLADAGFGA